jgi:type VI secretion system protein VasD
MTVGRRTLIAALPALAAAACAKQPPPPAQLALAVSAGADQNGGSPVAVRVFQLTDAARFERADPIALMRGDRSVLAEDLAGSQELVLAPGESRSISAELKHGVTVLGIAAFFRDIDRAHWRASAPVPATGTVRLELRTDAQGVSLSPAKAAS